MVKKDLVVVCIFCLLAVTLVCGCTSVTEKKLEQATTLIESANEKLTEVEDLEWNKENIGYIKAQWAGAEVDLDEALKILYTIEPANKEEGRMIDAYKVLCTAAKDLCNLMRTDFVDGMEHLFKAQEYSGNIASWRSELQSAKSDFKGAHTKSLRIQQSIKSISVSDLPAEERGSFTSFSVIIDELVDALAELVDTLNSAV
ncbi:hypothetical protein KH990_11125 [Methanoculleus bourgensis]|jgi:outer membrane murein-binding lipoprotein Lpp|uniref:Lipoprotein n=1 Tax=Methanoculleus bourgensis TaxID=83986 RepID=A0A0X3BI90_9EURY|nr:hypothetical protein [Methanoculleus bourgensis]MBT0733904.1 hypothetical protein [Methanoculleus bourgensis]GLI47624.1 hypothetical protein MBOURGENBZM_24160 [Methanoculleus bourgensis]CVK31778.1 exported protein of unknown function [Methanoculleus bourgensis]SAI87592.1 hypothetical protein MBBA_0716 [Methanoculleus bourgensis]